MTLQATPLAVNGVVGRTVTVASVDHLQAKFAANAFVGRVEGGYRFAMPMMGVSSNNA